MLVRGQPHQHAHHQNTRPTTPTKITNKPTGGSRVNVLKVPFETFNALKGTFGTVNVLKVPFRAWGRVVSP
jgi:hypothetical protein